MTRLLFILFMLMAALYTGLMSVAHAGDYPEPKMEWLMGWVLEEEAPGKATLYYDIDRDGEPDLVFMHDIIGQEMLNRPCPPPARHEKEITLGANCEGRPMLYTLKREIVAVRWASEQWLWVATKTWGVCGE